MTLKTFTETVSFLPVCSCVGDYDDDSGDEDGGDDAQQLQDTFLPSSVSPSLFTSASLRPSFLQFRVDKTTCVCTKTQQFVQMQQNPDAKSVLFAAGQDKQEEKSLFS